VRRYGDREADGAADEVRFTLVIVAMGGWVLDLWLRAGVYIEGGGCEEIKSSLSLVIS